MSIFAVTISGERSALFLIILTLIYLVIMLKLKLKFLIIFSLIIFAGISSILTFNESIKNRVINFTKNQIISDEKIYFFSKDHTGHYLASIDIFNRNNKLIGIGPKILEIIVTKIKNTPNYHTYALHTHNTYIQLLTEVGIIGFHLLCLLYYF